MQRGLLSVVTILSYLAIGCQGEQTDDIVKSRVARATTSERADYTLHSGIFYRFHNIPETFQDAQELCRFQGANLVVPKNIEEVKYLTGLFTKSTNRIWIGMHSLYASQTFITVTGEHYSDIFYDWDRDEPADVENRRLCVMLKDGKLVADVCSCKNKFICATKGWNGMINTACKGYSSGYKISRDGTVCYKAYEEPKTWEWALKICNADGARLPRIRSHDQAAELGAIVTESKKAYSIGKQYNGTHPYTAIGFISVLNPTEKKFIYDDGKTLRESGYETWLPNKPNNGPDDICGYIHLNGLLDNIRCTFQMHFICESDKLF